MIPPGTIQNKEVATLASIAEHVGVSVSTVSRVLSGKAKTFRIKTETEQAIRSAAEELNYIPNNLATSLRLKKTNIIGLVIPDISNQFFASMARYIENESRKMNYSIILCDTQENTELEIDSINALMKHKVDGLLICPVGIEFDHIKKIYEKGTPLVIIDRYQPDYNFPYVVSDNYQGSMKAIHYLAGNGHKKIACIQGLNGTSVNNDRVRGYQDALHQNQIELNENYILGDSFSIDNGYISAKLLLSLPDKPTAIFALSNLISIGVLRALQEEGFEVPRDISIVSFDDQPYSDFLITPMTTIKQLQKEMGRIACKLLTNQIESENQYSNKKITLPTELVIRKSVRNIAG